MEDAIFVHFTPKGETVNSQNYCDMFTPMKESLRGRRFSSNEEVIGVVQNLLKTQKKKKKKNFYDGI
jgi:hypothetical protein